VRPWSEPGIFASAMSANEPGLKFAIEQARLFALYVQPSLNVNVIDMRLGEYPSAPPEPTLLDVAVRAVDNKTVRFVFSLSRIKGTSYLTENVFNDFVLRLRAFRHWNTTFFGRSFELIAVA
jgi:hypothetical protein